MLWFSAGPAAAQDANLVTVDINEALTPDGADAPVSVHQVDGGSFAFRPDRILHSGGKASFRLRSVVGASEANNRRQFLRDGTVNGLGSPGTNTLIGANTPGYLWTYTTGAGLLGCVDIWI